MLKDQAPSVSSNLKGRLRAQLGRLWWLGRRRVRSAPRWAKIPKSHTPRRLTSTTSTGKIESVFSDSFSLRWMLESLLMLHVSCRSKWCAASKGAEAICSRILMGRTPRNMINKPHYQHLIMNFELIIEFEFEIVEIGESKKINSFLLTKLFNSFYYL